MRKFLPLPLLLAILFVLTPDVNSQNPAFSLIQQEEQPYYSNLSVEATPETGVYVGGHFRRNRPATVSKLKASGFNYVILFNVHVESNGTLTTDGETICKDGVYVFAQTQPNYVNDVTSLKQAPTSITRVEICIGGWDNNSWSNIKSLVASQGTGQTSILYKNFKALKDAIPGIDAINNDEEYAYDVNSATAFHVMMYDLGYFSTVAPYMNKSYWQNLVNNVNAQRPDAVRRVYIQCYDGGAGNNPSDWHLSGIPLHAGRLNYQDFSESLVVMQGWKDNKQVTGGFFWVYNDETWNLNKYASSVNRIFKTAVASPVATFYGDSNHEGYSVGLTTGEYTTADLANYGITDNDISSLKVLPGYQVTVYDGDSFTGSSRVYITDAKALILNNMISSLKIEDTRTSFENQSAGNLPYMYSDAAGKKLLIDSDLEDQVTVFDGSGRKIFSGFLHQGHNSFDLNGVTTGFYFARLKSTEISSKFFIR